MEDESGVAGLARSTHDLRCLLFPVLPLVVFQAWTLVVLLVMALGQSPRRAGAGWRLVRLIGLAGVAAAPAAAAISPIAPAPLLQSQLSTTQEELGSQQSEVEEERQLQYQQSTIEEELQFQHSMTEELHSPIEEELHSQWSATEDDVQSQQLATEEDLQSAVQEGITVEEEHSRTEEELQSQWSATEEGFHSQQLATEEEIQSAVQEGIRTEEELHSTTEEELQSQWLATEEDVHSQQLATEEELVSAMEEDITTEGLHLSTEEELHSQWSATEEDVLSQQLATEEDLHSVVEEGITVEEELHSRTKEELQSQWSATEEGFQSQQLATEEELQSAVEEVIRMEELHLPTEEELHSQLSATEEDAQYEQLATEEEIQFATEEELHSQQSETAGCAEVAILHDFLLVDIWKTSSLKQCSRNLIASFMKINHPIQFAAAHSPNGSSCSSPRRFDYTYRDSLVNENNNDQFHQFKSLSLLDHGDIYLINDSSLLQLEDMILNNVFEDNSYVVDSFLCDCFKSVDLSIDALACMVEVDYESAKRFVLNFKVMARLLCLMKSDLDKVECISFDQNLKDCYFTLCARGCIQKIINAADSVSKLKWSASDIYQMLVLYEAIADVHGAFSYLNGSNRIFRQMQVYIEESFNRIFQQMQANFEGIFDSIKIFIDANLNGSCEITHGMHPTTNFLIHSMELFENHSSIVRCVCDGDDTSSLGDRLFKVIRYWADKLKTDTDSDSYAEGEKQIFLLKNLAPFTWEIKKPLQKLVPNVSDEIIEFLESLINKYTIEYCSKCWGPVRDYVELRFGRKPRSSSLKKFRSEFEAILDCQGTWVLETNLKRKLREDIKNYMTPCYCTFLQELRKKWYLCARLFFCKYITPEQLDKRLDNLFESGL